MAYSSGTGSRESIYAVSVTWQEWLWFASSLILNSLGIASLIDQLLRLPSFLSNGLYTYQVLTTQLLSWMPALDGAIPLPLWTVATQLFVVMGGVFCAANFYLLRTDGMTVFGFLFDRSKFQGNWLYRLQYASVRTAALYVVGPALCCYLVLVAMRAPYQTVFGLTFQPRKVASYYLTLIVVVVTALVGAYAIS